MNKKLSIVLIPIFLLLLATATVAYAMWSETLKVNVTAKTGELDWGFSSTVIVLDSCEYAQNNDYNATNYPDLSGMLGVTRLTKDVGCTNVTLIDSDNDNDYDTLNITIRNGYPWYYSHIEFFVCNNGTIPLKIWRLIINNGTHELTYYAVTGRVEIDLTGDGKPDVAMWWGDNFGLQLDPYPPPPNRTNCADISFDLTVLQDAPENRTLTFLLKLDAIQWNEYDENVP